MTQVTPAYIRELMAVERQAAAVKKRAVAPTQTRATEDALRAAFAVFDSDSRGHVKMIEFDLLVRSAGLVMTPEQIQAGLKSIDITPDADSLTLAQFIAFVNKCSKPQNSEEEARQVFRLLATGGKKKAEQEAEAKDPATLTITVEAMKAALESMDARISEQEVIEMVKYCRGVADKHNSTPIDEGVGGITEADWMDVITFVNEMGW